jgi:hypothetical protein
MMQHRLKFRDGFDWRRVAWGRPDSPPRPFCGYCHAHISDDDVPLMLWKPDGSGVQLCDECVEKWITSEPT